MIPSGFTRLKSARKGLASEEGKNMEASKQKKNKSANWWLEEESAVSLGHVAKAFLLKNKHL